MSDTSGSLSFGPMSPTDSDFFYFDFTNLLLNRPPPATADSIIGAPIVTCSPPNILVVGSPTILGALVGVQITGNQNVQAGLSFTLECDIETAQGRNLTRQAVLPITLGAIR